MSILHPPLSAAIQRRHRYRLRGQLQGVGFRPFVHRLARQCELWGWIRNDASGVIMELQGTEESLEHFAATLKDSLPLLARIDAMERTVVAVDESEREFSIHASEPSATADAAVTIDTALCAECRAELLDAGDSRHRHALINCTNCGPRFSILRDIPYDRPNTTMAGFSMCARCASEYRDPNDRRFHAQPTCCPECGPLLQLVSADGQHIAGDPVERAAQMLFDGKIVAIKGIGGFHLAVRADRTHAVARLRKLKHRDSKPFALMVADLPTARRLVKLSRSAQAELTSPAAPIMLASRRPGAAAEVVGGVAPGTHLLGVMVPYTPIQHLIFEHLAEWSTPHTAPALVMTSGNLSDEPLAITNADAFERLSPLCDALLLHDRPIERCVDDSVFLDRGAGQRPLAVRRSRGYVPTAWAIPAEFAGHPTGICLGGELKNTIALVRRNDVIASQHLGDLTHPLAYEHFKKAVADFTRLFDAKVEFVAHDLHPNYMSTHFARQLAAEHGVRLIPVQHHVAHAHAVLAENNIQGPALALSCDGTGYGTDGSTWGGELLHLDGGHWKRLGSLRPMRLPGGDAAAIDTRRSALALLHMAYGEEMAMLPAAAKLFPDAVARRAATRMLQTGFNSPWTTSTGRLFDGVAALLGLCERNQHEAQAPMALEAAAYRTEQHHHSSKGHAYFEITSSAGSLQLDLSPFIRHLVQSFTGRQDIDRLAAEFHQNLATGLIAMADAVNLPELPIAIGGGTFVNQILTRHLLQDAGRHERTILTPKNYSLTDSGLAFGQAIAVLQETRTA